VEDTVFEDKGCIPKRTRGCYAHMTLLLGTIARSELSTLQLPCAPLELEASVTTILPPLKVALLLPPCS
jgi:hypothetical protein